MMRDVIQHEDDLVDHRLNWLFAGHAVLFAGFVTVQADVVADKLVPQYIVVLELALAAMFAAAFVIARADGYLIALANVSHSRAAHWWDTVYPEESFVPIDVKEIETEEQIHLAGQSSSKPREWWHLSFMKLAPFDCSISKKYRHLNIRSESFPPVRGVFKESPWLATLSNRTLVV